MHRDRRCGAGIVQCVAIATTFAVVSFACGPDGPDAEGPTSTIATVEPRTPEPHSPVTAASAAPDPAVVAAGRDVALGRACASCHGRDFDGATGPSWIGLAGSTVVLADGRTVIADETYLRRAILEPQSDIVDGYIVKMPTLALDDAEVDALIAFISSLG